MTRRERRIVIAAGFVIFALGFVGGVTMPEPWWARVLTVAAAGFCGAFIALGAGVLMLAGEDDNDSDTAGC